MLTVKRDRGSNYSNWMLNFTSQLVKLLSIAVAEGNRSRKQEYSFVYRYDILQHDYKYHNVTTALKILQCTLYHSRSKNWRGEAVQVYKFQHLPFGFAGLVIFSTAFLSATQTNRQENNMHCNATRHTRYKAPFQRTTWRAPRGGSTLTLNERFTCNGSQSSQTASMPINSYTISTFDNTWLY